MNVRFTDSTQFEDFKQILIHRLQARTLKRIGRPGFAPAAVLILIINKNGIAHVVLTKRTTQVKSHKGEVSFPGGQRHPDESLLHTALRETNEEIGVNPEQVQILGQFDEYLSIHGYHVSTFVGSISHPYAYAINRDEIEAMLEVPLSMFRDQTYDKLQTFTFEGEEHSIYYYSYEGFTVWGLTARILTDLCSAVLLD